MPSADASKSSESRWNPHACQARSRVTQDLILDSAEELFAERGIDATSVQDVAAHAGRSIGSLYHHFDTKGLLVDAVVDRIIEGVAIKVDSFFAPGRWDGHNIEQRLQGYLSNTLALDQGRPGFGQIGREASMSNAETAERYRKSSQRVNTALRDLLLECRDEIHHPVPDLAVGVVVDQVRVMTRARVDKDATPTLLLDVGDDDYVEAVLDSALAYLRVER